MHYSKREYATVYDHTSSNLDQKKTLRVSAVNDNGVCGLCAKGTELLSSRESLSSDLTNYKLLGLGARWTRGVCVCMCGAGGGGHWLKRVVNLYLVLPEEENKAFPQPFFILCNTLV